MMRRWFVLPFLIGLSSLVTACQPQAVPEIDVKPAEVKFSGQRALEIETEFVQQFPRRHSGQPNNGLAAEWLLEHFGALGFVCKIDRWQVINYSRPFPLNNVVCRLPGESDKEILVIAHLDQAPTTVQGADNDGSGIAVLLELAEILAAEPTHAYTLAFVATDGEEYGMLGSGHYIQTHPDPSKVLTGISLDNLGRTYYDGMSMELIGQFKGYGPIWLALTAREAARGAGAEWTVNLRSVFDQITDQAAPVSLMDEGPLVAAGVPAIGLSAHVPPEFTDQHFNLWHDPSDTLEHQSAATLHQSGVIAEALIRQLLGMRSLPQESGPYLYFDETGQVLRGMPLWAIFIGFVAIWFAGSLLAGRRLAAETVRGWIRAVPHFLGLWLPLVGSVLLLYGMVAVGLMDGYYRYPATTKDPLLYHPRWPAVILFLAGLTVLLLIGRMLVRRTGSQAAGRDIKSFGLLVIALGGAYILAVNPFGLFFMVPLLFWLVISENRGWGRALNVMLFLLGGLIVYALVYVFGFVVLRLNFAFLWYMLNMFSIGMIRFPMAAVILAIMAAGLAMIVGDPRSRETV